MKSASSTAARAAIAELELNGANRDVAAHWLSRWNGDKPPTMASFNRREPWSHTPALSFFEVRKDEYVRCLRAGTFYKLALGYDLKDHDLMSITNSVDRPERLTWCWDIVQGAVTMSYRMFKSKSGSDGLAQAISLPFCDAGKTGTGYFLSHVNWRPVGEEWIEGTVQADPQIAGRKLMRKFMVDTTSSAAAA